MLIAGEMWWPDSVVVILYGVCVVSKDLVFILSRWDLGDFISVRCFCLGEMPLMRLCLVGAILHTR